MWAGNPTRVNRNHESLCRSAQNVDFLHAAQLQELPQQQGRDTSTDCAALPGSAPSPSSHGRDIPALPFPIPALPSPTHSSSSCSLRHCCSHSQTECWQALREVTTSEFPLSDLQVKIKLLLSKHKNPIVLLRKLQSPTAGPKSHFSPHLCWS